MCHGVRACNTIAQRQQPEWEGKQARTNGIGSDVGQEGPAIIFAGGSLTFFNEDARGSEAIAQPGVGIRPWAVGIACSNSQALSRGARAAETQSLTSESGQLYWVPDLPAASTD